ncbi:MAG: hypothetical protein HYY36_07460 [Gammaproteobacteria bacterium]|nr:hypothetical protein [Gammaproteobacteria bacterium]
MLTSSGAARGNRPVESEQILHSFVVRLWLERGANGEALWRGHIRHVQNDRETYIRDLAEMRDFVEEISGVPGPAVERHGARRGIQT